jgi:hypothetical protein
MRGLSSILLAAVLAFPIPTALAASNGAGKSDQAPGQAVALANCVANILKQNAKGQTGAKNGNSNDKKQQDTAVTNCDHYWDDPVPPRPVSSP